MAITQILKLRISGNSKLNLRKYLYDQIPRYDVKIQYKLGKEELVVRVLTKYAEQRGKTRQACRLEFIEIISKKESFGRSYFTVKVDSLSQDLRDIKDQVILAPGETDVRLLTLHYVKILLTPRRKFSTSNMFISKSGAILMFCSLCYTEKKTLIPQKSCFRQCL